MNWLRIGLRALARGPELLTLLILISLAALPALAGTDEHTHGHIHGSHPECPLPKTAMAILRCAQELQPDVRRAKLDEESSETLMGAASQIPNPEVEVQSVFGRPQGSQQMQTQISLAQPIEYSGARGARKQEAEARYKQSKADLRQVQAQVTLQTVVRLHRIRQLVREKAIQDEAISTYSKLVSQYRSRPRLTPEQEVSMSVFEMALSDSRLKRSVLLEEEREHGHFFHVSTGHGIEEIRKALPEVPRTWPVVEAPTEKPGMSPQVFRLMADQELAGAELESARAAAWPGLRVGPMAQLQSDGPNRAQLYGFQLNIDLPLFNINGGARAHASRNVLSSEKALSIRRE